MRKMVEVSILKTIPQSGMYTEYQFDTRGDCTWVKFQTCGKETVGVFGNGVLTASSSAAIVFYDCEHVFVLASGRPYVIHANDMKLTFSTDVQHLYQAHSVPALNLIVGSDNNRIIMFSPFACVWSSERLGQDEVRINHVSNLEVVGQYWDGGGYRKFAVPIPQIVKQ